MHWYIWYIWTVTDLCSSDIFHSSLRSCRAIISFAHEVPICDVSAAVMDVFQSEKQISYNGQVTRAGVYLKCRDTSQQVNVTSIRTCREIMACVLWDFSFVFCLICHTAICGNSAVSNNPLNSQFTFVEVNLKPDAFCMTTKESTILNWLVLSSYNPILCTNLTKSLQTHRTW